MAQNFRERRKSWSQADVERIHDYAREWMSRQRVEEIREQRHDERCRTIHPSAVVRHRTKRSS